MTELSENIRIVVADNHEFYRQGLVSFLKKQKEITVVGEAENGKQLIKIVNQLRPDVVLTDLRMPEIDGVAAIKEIMASGAVAKCIVLSSFDFEYLIIEAIEAGANGYIVKDVQEEEIMAAIRSVYHNKKYYCSTVSARLANNIKRNSSNISRVDAGNLLNKKEIEIVRLLCREESSNEIAKKLFMGKKNVDFQRAKIRAKINVKTTIGLIIYAVKNGLCDLED